MGRSGKNHTQFKLRLEHDLHTRLSALAKVAGRSLNGEICERLKRSLLADDLKEVVRHEVRTTLTSLWEQEQ